MCVKLSAGPTLFRYAFMKTRTLYTLLALLCCCGSVEAQDYSTASPRSVKIGVIQSLTGIAAEDGRTVVQALQLAAHDIQSMGISSVELLIEDDASQSRNAVSAFKKLKAGQVEGIIGATWDFTTNALLPVSGQSETLLFNTSTLPESLGLEGAKGFGFINAVTASEEASAFRRFVKDGGFKRLVIVFANNSWGETQAAIYRSIAVAQGVEISDEIRSSTYDANEWGLLASRIKQRGPDLVLLLLNRSDLEMFLRKSNELELKAAFFASKNLYDAFRVSRNASVFERVCFTYPLEQLQSEREFRRKYEDKFGEEPRIYADTSYDALFILVKGVLLSRRENRPLRDALRRIEHDGLAGHYKYSQTFSFSLGSSSLVCVKDGNIALK